MTPNHGGWTESQEQIDARWERMKKQAEEIEKQKEAALAASNNTTNA